LAILSGIKLTEQGFIVMEVNDNPNSSINDHVVP
jgi:glutathione synthase/RimK-type ligase-like ATP-grasp enzyme